VKERPEEESRRDLTLQDGGKTEERGKKGENARFSGQHCRHPRHFPCCAQKVQQADSSEPIKVVHNLHASLLRLLCLFPIPSPCPRLRKRDATIQKGVELVGDTFHIQRERFWRKGVAFCRPSGGVSNRSRRSSNLFEVRLAPFDQRFEEGTHKSHCVVSVQPEMQ
jgi:hypothetical protein